MNWECWKGRIDIAIRWRHNRQRRDRRITPVHDSPVLGAAQVLHNILEGLVVLFCRSLSKTREKRGRVANVNAAGDVGIDNLAKHLSIAISNLPFQFLMFCCAFKGTLKGTECLCKISGKRNGVMTIGLLEIRFFPAMSLQNSVGCRFHKTA